jgi:hypothetical protein
MKGEARMTSTVKYMIAGVGVLMMAMANASAADVTIDVNSTPQIWANPWESAEGYEPSPIKPTHVARLFVAIDTSHWPQAKAVLATPTAATMSEAQKGLLFTGQGVLTLDKPRIVGAQQVRLIPNCIGIELYGVSENECRRMVKAYMEAMDKETGSEEANAEHRVRDCMVSRDRTQQKLDQNTAEIDKIVSKSGVVLSPEDVGRIASTAEEMRNSLQIDVAGLNARIAEITKTLGKGGGTVGGIDDATRTRLQQMLIDQSIELAGVLAKLKALDEARTGAKEKYMDSLRLIDLRKESEEARGKLAKAEDAIQQAERALQKVKAETVEPQIFQNKVTIYPVKDGK